MNRAALHALVSGQVQGVGFRVFTKRSADGLGLVGFVRNRSDGAVEVVAEGERSLLEMLHGTLRQGPRAARVEDVAVSWREPSGAYHDFRIRS